MLKKIDKPLLIISIILFFIGLASIYSASNIYAYRKFGNALRFVGKETAVLIVSIGIGYIFRFLYTKKRARGLSTLILLACIAALILVHFYGKVSGNARSWFDLGRVDFQPSEFAKIGLILWMSAFYDPKDQSKLLKWTYVLIPVVVSIGMFISIFLEPDLGTALIFAFIAIYIFFSAPSSKKIRFVAGSLLIVGAIGAVVALKATDYGILGENQKARIKMLEHNPCSEEYFYNKGNQLCNGYIAINNGGITGLGIGNSIQKNLYLPAAYTDFIICIIMEETGLVGLIILLVLYFLLIWRILYIGHKADNITGKLLCNGACIYFISHIAVNLLGVFGLIPMTGVPLPFISYGGSFTCCVVIILMAVQKVCIESPKNN